MAKVRIAVLGTRGFPDVQGGVERHCEELYSKLAKMNCTIRVYARKGYLKPDKRIYKGVEIYPVWTPRKKSVEAIIHTFLCILHIGVNKKRFDIVHIHGIGPALLTPLARLFGLKVIVTNHGPDYERQKWGKLAKAMLRLGEQMSIRFATSIICVAQNLKKSIFKKYGRETFYIPNGVPVQTKTLPGELLKKRGLKAGKYLLAVGRFVPEKGFHDLIEAFKGIKTDWNLVIAGGADHEDDYSLSLKEMAKNDSRVVLTGFISGTALSEIYSNAGFFVLPSYHEGLPIAVLEAMSYGLPILASSIQANMELIDEKYSFRPGDREMMAMKIKGFMNLSGGHEMVAGNLRRIKREFNWDSIACKVLTVYETALAPVKVSGEAGVFPQNMTDDR